MTERTLQKWHGAGNDFLVEVTSVDGAKWWTPPRAAAVCDRHLGVGADGLMIAALDEERLTMTLFNADGSRAEMSGNGIRCLVAAVARSTSDAREQWTVLTDAGTRLVTLALDGERGTGSVAMGPVTLEEPLPGSLGVARVGNPHVVVSDQVPWSDHDREKFAADLSGQLGGANVEFVSVLSPDHVSLVVVERGVGWTMACGTGSVATVAVLYELGLVGSTVTVDSPGGALTVTLDDGEATLAGPVQFVADVSWSAA